MLIKIHIVIFAHFLCPRNQQRFFIYFKITLFLLEYLLHLFHFIVTIYFFSISSRFLHRWELFIKKIAIRFPSISFCFPVLQTGNRSIERVYSVFFNTMFFTMLQCFYNVFSLQCYIFLFEFFSSFLDFGVILEKYNHS